MNDSKTKAEESTRLTYTGLRHCDGVFYRIVSFLIPNPQHTNRRIRLCIKNQCACRWEVYLFLVSEESLLRSSSPTNFRFICYDKHNFSFLKHSLVHTQ